MRPNVGPTYTEEDEQEVEWQTPAGPSGLFAMNVLLQKLGYWM